MRIVNRLSLVGIVLSAGLAGQVALHRHIGVSESMNVTPLAKSLAEFPLKLGAWQGLDRPITNENLLYADEHVLRTYRRIGRSQEMTLWMAYSDAAADRLHYPEICAAAAGQPEDLSGRMPVAVANPGAPVQQYRFGWPGSFQLIFYWHYTLPRAERRKLTAIQQFYQHARHRRSSVTIEVFTPELSSDDDEFAHEFVRLVDDAIQEHVGHAAVRGSRRIPATAAG